MNGQETKHVNIGMVERPVPPVRDHFDEQEMARLVASIRDNGILVPLLVRPRGDKFEVIDGDRRLNAAWQAGLREIPVVVRNLNDSETHVQRMLANLDRHDPDPVSEAKYIASVVNGGEITIEQFAEKLGRTIDWIEGRLTIAEMPDYMQKALSEQLVSLGVCMELHQIKDEAVKDRYFSEAIRNGMTVHAAKINRMQVNEAIEALEQSGEEVTVESVPTVQTVPKVICEITGETLYVTETRMVRVGIKNLEEWRKVRDQNGRTLPEIT